MKIDFQIIKFPNNYNYNSLPNIENNMEYRNSSNIDIPYYVPFGCAEMSFDKKMESLSGVHCPSCGVKMLPKQELNEILEQGKGINNFKDYMKFIDLHKESINPKFFVILDELANTSLLLQDDNVNNIILAAKEAKNQKLEEMYERQFAYLDTLIEGEDLSESDKNLLKICEISIYELKNNKLKREIVSEYTDIIRNYIYKMESDKRIKISEHLKSEFIKEYFQNSLYNFPQNADKDLYGYYVLKNLLRYSSPRFVKMDDNVDESKIYNKILLCKRCEKTKKRSVNNIIKADKEHLEIYKTFISDISRKSIDGELGDEKMYPVFLHGHLRKVSSKTLDIIGTTANAMLKKPRFEINKAINFDLVDIEGIPCACCKKPTISHKNKIKLQDEIEKAKDKFEILAILNRNRDIIRWPYISIVNKFEEILKENPQATDEEVFQMLKIYSKERIKNALVNVKNYAEKQLKNNQYTYFEKICIQKYIDNVNKYYMDTNYDGTFNFYEYVQMVNNTLAPIPKIRKGKLLEVLRCTVKEKVAGQFVVHPLPKVLANYDSPLKVFAQDIIKQSVATKDHFIAKHLSGSDNPNNLIVLCKSCNQFKGNLSVYDWIKHDKRIIANFQNYFDYISDGIRSGKIDSSKIEYLKDLQMAAYDASKGKMDMAYDSDFVI